MKLCLKKCYVREECKHQESLIGEVCYVISRNEGTFILFPVVDKIIRLENPSDLNISLPHVSIESKYGVYEFYVVQ